MSESKQSFTRWWPLIVIWVLAVIGWILFAFTSDLNRQLLIMRSIGTAVAACALSMMWLLALSRLPWRIRLKALGAAVLLLMVLEACFALKVFMVIFCPLLNSAGRVVKTGWLPDLWIFQSRLRVLIRSFESRYLRQLSSCLLIY